MDLASQRRPLPAILVVLLFLLPLLGGLLTFFQPLPSSDTGSIDPQATINLAGDSADTSDPASSDPATSDSVPLGGHGFTVNDGQAGDTRIKFIHRGEGATYGFMVGGYQILLAGRHGRAETLTVEFANGNPASPAGVEPLSRTTSYLMGKEPDNWMAGVQTYGKVIYRELHPGIDLVFSSTPSGLKYDYLVAPDAEPGLIRQVYTGSAGSAPRLTLRADGSLLVNIGTAELREAPPYTYQTVAGEPHEVDSDFHIEGQTVSYDLAPHDTTRELVIDPLIYSTYLGGDDGNESYTGRIAIGPYDSVYVCGSTMALDFPISNTTFTEAHKGGHDIFLTRLNATGREVLYSTFIGGSGRDSCSGLAIDEVGNIYLSGTTNSPDFPTTQGSFANTSNGRTEEGFVLKLNPKGDGLIFSTYYGGEGYDVITDMVFDEQHRVIATGYTNSWDLPTTANGFDPWAKDQQSDWNCFLFQLDPTGSFLEYASYFGGNSSEYCNRMDLGPDGSVYLAGETLSRNLPTTPGAYANSSRGGYDVFLARFNTSLSGNASLTYASYLGGQSTDDASDLAVDGEGKVYLMGQTWSDDLPIPQEGYQSSKQDQDIFVIKLDLDTSTVEAGTYLGGSSSDWGIALALDDLSNVHVLGSTYSTDLNTTSTAFQERYNNKGDIFLTVLNADLTNASYVSYFGGASYDYATDLVLDPDNRTTAFVTGHTNSIDFPVTMASHDISSSGQGYTRDAVVFKISPSSELPRAIIDSITPTAAIQGDNVTFTGHAKVGSLWGWCAWYSSLDGLLNHTTGLASQFTTDDLSVGEHRIWFRVLDQSGVWSDDVNRVITIRPGPRPDAIIRSIAPSPAKAGEPVIFLGVGLDNGNLSRYVWRSSLDGELYNGSEANFTLDNLSLGDHHIYFMVQDDEGLWSQEVGRQLAVVENLAPAIKVVSLDDGATIYGTVKMSGTAYDLDGDITRVEYRVDGQGWQEAVGTYLWYLQLDTTFHTDGEHSLSFRSYDGLEHSPEVTYRVTIDNLNGSRLRPDFRITSNYMSVHSPVSGSPTEIEIRVDNVGLLEGTVNVSLYLGAVAPDGLIGSSQLTIPANGSGTALIPWTPSISGENLLRVVLSDRSAVPETELGDNQAELMVRVGKAEASDDGPLATVGAPEAVAISAGAFGGLFLLGLAGHEGLRYRAFLTLFPLYSHLRKNEIEKDLKEQSVRGRIYQHIIENPGTHFSLIRKAVKAGNGTTCYHLDVLEREGFVKSIKKGRCRYYFETGIHFPYRLQTRISATAMSAMNALHQAGCVSVSELAELLDKSIPTASDTIKTLQRKGFVECEREHKVKLCSLTDKGVSFLLKHIKETPSG